METVLTGFQEAGTDGGKAQVHFEEVQKSNIAIYAVLSAHFRAYIQALEKLQLDIATSTDLLGVETRSTGFLFSIGKEPLKSCSSVFALGERINILKQIVDIKGMEWRTT